MKIKNIAVAGSGIMGSDIAMVLAGHGYNVVLKDLRSEILAKARAKIEKDFRLVKILRTEMKSVSLEDILSRIDFTTTYDRFGSVEMVIENIVEDWEAKKNLYGDLAGVCGAETIYAVNTSCISITRVAALMKSPDKVIGVHFLNPAPLKNLVEVIRGYHTSDETVTIIKTFIKTLKKKSVVVNDLPGFASNRVSHLFINEAAYLVQDGVAGPKDVDMIFTQGFGHKMGPLATADLAGLDTVVRGLDVLYDSYQDPKFRCCPLLRKMVDAGLLGQKSGKGFFEY